MQAQRQVAEATDRDRCPELEQPPGDHGQHCNGGRRAEADQGRDEDAFDDAQAAGADRQGAEQVGYPVGDEQRHGVDAMGVGGQERP